MHGAAFSLWLRVRSLRFRSLFDVNAPIDITLQETLLMGGVYSG